MTYEPVERDIGLSFIKRDALTDIRHKAVIFGTRFGPQTSIEDVLFSNEVVDAADYSIRERDLLTTELGELKSKLAHLGYGPEGRS